MLRRLYDNYVLEYPLQVFLLLLVLIGFLGYQAQKLEVDASAETLILENDEDLRFTRVVNERYGSADFLVVMYSPKKDLLDDSTLDQIRKLKGELAALDMVESVTTILDVPLLESPPKPIQELLDNVPTLESPGIDKDLARKEFVNSPIYRNLLVSPDFTTTAMQVNLREDETHKTLLAQRNTLRQKELDGIITPSEKAVLEGVLREFKAHRDQVRIEQHENIAAVRAILDRYRGDADIFLGGISMIADDLITFIKSDLGIFGIGVLIFLVITLMIIFRQKRWVLLPILCCAFSVVATAGILGLFGWEVTVISSNFISIQLIITMAMTIHLIVRYRELSQAQPDATQRELILDTVLSMAKPCFYAVLTTIAGFASLILSDILPVINFGWMMSAGIGVSLFLTFLTFPVVLMLMKKKPVNTSFESKFGLTTVFANLTESRGKAILWFSALLMAASAYGSSRLLVENSFIDFFKESTEIYQGMKVIDQQLGGTTTLDVILDFKEDVVEETADAPVEEGDDEFDDFDEFEDEFAESSGEAQYWFTEDKMEKIEKIHDYLDDLPETGKVLSLGTLIKVGRTINEGKPLDNFMMALVYNDLPERFRKIILSPYVSVEENQVRFSVRVRDSDPNLRRNELLKQIEHDMTHKLELDEGQVRLASLLVLYNNMLQSLFDSQILTLGVVIAALMFMFLILFRSIKIAAIAIFPNVLSVGAVLGFMGYAKIPLDLMTITIAAISVGIAVDDTIHYIHRFIKEFEKDRNYVATMHRCHESIGHAMYYTSVTIIIGFSILVLSNFIPSIYFGLLTGLAMVIALVASLTLLPQLMVAFKPLGKEGK